MAGRLRRAALSAAVLVIAAALPVASAPAEPTVRFSAAGDFSNSLEARSVFSTIGALNNDLTIALGDLSYGATGTEQDWCDLVKAGVGQKYPFELVSGNHESNGLNGNINDFGACLPNQLPGVTGTYGRQYFVDVPASAPLVRFVNVSPNLDYPDGTWSYAAGSPRYQWTATAIDSARAAGIPWVVVSMHKPCLSVGFYTCDPGADFINMLVGKKVDLVLSGHDHVYQRTKQLGIGAGCSALVPNVFNASCVVDSRDAMAAGAGTVFATVGTGGVPLRDVSSTDPEAPYFAAAQGLNQNPTWGVLDVSVTAGVFSARFARAAGGTFADAFSLTKGAAPPNQNPIALFTPTCAQLACTVDGTASGDPDGTIASYAWQFGDGATATGANANHTYAAGGTYTIRLTVTDDKGATGTTTSTVTVTPANQPPTAGFTADCDNLSCLFDAGTSKDVDGTISSYAWQFGDGTTATGPSATHAYAAAGTYTVRLTVTDNQQATGTTTSPVTVAAAPPPVTDLASDAFGRTLATGWGPADLGGSWTTSSPASNLSVADGVGKLRLTAGFGPWIALAAVSSSSTDVVTSMSLDKVPTGSGLYASLTGRRISGVGDYRGKVRYLADGTIAISLQRTNAAGAETAISPEVAVSGLRPLAGDRLKLRVQVTGTSPTTVRARVWKADQTEPTTWQRSVTDSTAGYQVAGGVGVFVYLSGGATNAPVVASFDDFKAVPGP